MTPIIAKPYCRTCGKTARLEGGVGASAFASGTAAIATLMGLFAPGDERFSTDDLYGGSIRFFNNICSVGGLQVSSLRAKRSNPDTKLAGKYCNTWIAQSGLLRHCVPRNECSSFKMPQSKSSSYRRRPFHPLRLHQSSRWFEDNNLHCG